MSASIRPTFLPSLASDTARLTATVDLPTPPLPDATAMNSVPLNLSSVSVPDVFLNCSITSASSSAKRRPTERAPASFIAFTILICKSNCY